MTHIIYDIETERLPLPGTPTNRVVCQQWGRSGSEHITTGDDEAAFTAILDSGCAIVAHHCDFDFGAACAQWPHLTERILAARLCDTEIMAKLDAIERGIWRDKGKPVRSSLLACLERYDLVDVDEHEALVRDKTDEGSWRKRYGELLGVPIDRWPVDARRYALLDVTYTDRLYCALEEYVERTIPLARALVCLRLTTYRGIRIDSALVRRIGDEARAAAENATGLVIASGLASVGKDGKLHMARAKVQAAVSAAYRRLGRYAPRSDPSTSYPSGQVRTDADTLARSGHPVLAEWAGAAGAHKLVTAYCDPWLGRTRVHPEYRLPQATCRTSASDPNIQNPPSRRKSRFRDVFRPEPGMVWVDIDYGQIELVATAQLCLWWGLGDHLAAAIRDRVDVHWTVARRRLGLGVVDRDKDNVAWELARAKAKAVTFGRLGLLGATALRARIMADGGEISLEDARAMISAYEAEYPCVAAYLERQTTEHAYGRPAEIYGEGGPLGDDVIRRQCTYPTEQCNTPFQGLVARGALAAVTAVTKASLAAGGRWWLSAFIHDELLLQAPENEASAVLEEVSGIMVGVMQRHVPDVPVRVEGHVGPYWDH